MFDLMDMDFYYSTGVEASTAEQMRSVPVHVFPYERISKKAHSVFVDTSVGNFHAPTGFTSAAMIPLIAGDDVVGMLTIGNYSRHDFTDAEKDTLLVIGREPCAAIARMRAEDGRREYARAN